jgi:dTDP-4-dehydrorhamnose 3,5-epimerase
VLLPHGVTLRRLVPHRDERGAFTELFRSEWGVGVDPVQWNAVVSAPNVLRGVHVHPRHDDYLIVHAGRAAVGLCDLRPGSPTEGDACLVEVDGAEPAALTIPHGVAHGFWFLEASSHIYAVSHTWDPADELGCHWADPELGISWPAGEPRISERDAGLPPLAGLLAALTAEAERPQSRAARSR